MSTYTITREPRAGDDVVLLKIGFGEQQATNDVIVKDAQAQCVQLGDIGGKLCLLNGPASLPVAFVLCHHLAHRFGAVAVFDPKLGGYVVAVSHDPDNPVGKVIGK